MKKNICKFNRIIRIFVGILIIAAGVYYKSLLGLIGIIPLFTGIIIRCPLYAFLVFIHVNQKRKNYEYVL